MGTGAKMARVMAAAVEDTTRAHRWMVENAGPLKVDIHCIAVGGSSANAITLMMPGYVIDDHGIINVPEIGVIMDKGGEVVQRVFIKPCLLRYGHNNNKLKQL
jgi:hypothetical protein